MSVAVPADPGIRLRGLRRTEYERLVGLGEFEGGRGAQISILRVTIDIDDVLPPPPAGSQSSTT